MANYYIDYTNGNDAQTGLRIPTSGNNTVDSTADTTHLTDAALTGANDYINGSFLWNVTRSAGSLITDFDAASDTATLGTAIVGMSAGDEYYILDSWKTINKYTTTTTRTAGDIAYVRANQTHTYNSADIVFDEDGTATAPISIIGCDSVTNDPWHDASDVIPTISFGDAAYQANLNTDDYWVFTRLVFKESNENAAGIVHINSGNYITFNSCSFTDNSHTGGFGCYVGGGNTVIFNSCIFKDNLKYSLNILSNSRVLVNSCTFDGGTTTTDHGIYTSGGSYTNVYGSTFGSTTAHDLQDITNNGGGTFVYCSNCTFNKASLNMAGFIGAIYSDDDDGTFGSQVAYYYLGKVTKDATARSGGASSSAKIMPSTSECTIALPMSLKYWGAPNDPDFAVWLAADVSKTITIYMRSVTTWGGTYPTAAECYVTFSYLSNAASAARTTVTTNEVFTDATTWVAFDSGAIVPARSGWVYIKVYLGKYTASNGIYVDIAPVIT